MFYLFASFLLLGLVAPGFAADPNCLPDESWYMLVPGTCDQFYICLNGHLTTSSCPPGMEWSSTAQSCVMSSDPKSDCFETTLCDSITEPEEVLISHPDDCTMYIICHNTSSYLIGHCPAGLFFDESRQWCNFPEYTGCIPHSGTTRYPYVPTAPPESPDPRCNEVIQPQYFKHPSDCEKYIACFYGEGFEFTCPEHFHFEDADDLCVTPYASGCL